MFELRIGTASLPFISMDSNIFLTKSVASGRPELYEIPAPQKIAELPDRIDVLISVISRSNIV